MVPGEQISAKMRCSSSQTAVVPFGERLGVPSGHTEAIKPSRCTLTTRFMSSVSRGRVFAFIDTTPLCRKQSSGSLQRASHLYSHIVSVTAFISGDEHQCANVT